MIWRPAVGTVNERVSVVGVAVSERRSSATWLPSGAVAFPNVLPLAAMPLRSTKVQPEPDGA